MCGVELGGEALRPGPRVPRRLKSRFVGCKLGRQLLPARLELLQLGPRHGKVALGQREIGGKALGFCAGGL